MIHLLKRVSFISAILLVDALSWALIEIPLVKKHSQNEHRLMPSSPKSGIQMSVYDPTASTDLTSEELTERDYFEQ